MVYDGLHEAAVQGGSLLGCLTAAEPAHHRGMHNPEAHNCLPASIQDEALAQPSLPRRRFRS